MAFPRSEELLALISPVSVKHSVDIESIRIAKAGAKSTVAIKVDAENSPDLDLLETISKEIGELFDAAEERRELNFGAGYQLEVSTPGIDSPLTLPRHWRRNRGRLVAVELDGIKRICRIGALNEAETAVVLIERQQRKLETFVLELVQSPHAVVEIEFAKPPQDELLLAEHAFNEVAGESPSQA